MVLGRPAAHGLRQGSCMNSTIETLAALQELTFRTGKKPSKDQQTNISLLREKIPAPVLLNFDRHVVRGNKGVAPVRNGVCSACHLRVPMGIVASLVSSPNLLTCESCGTYLMLVPNEDVVASEVSGSSKVTVRRMPKKARVAAKVAVTEVTVSPQNAKVPTVSGLVAV